MFKVYHYTRICDDCFIAAVAQGMAAIHDFFEKVKTKLSKQWLFLTLGLAMFALVSWFIIYNFIFLARNFNEAFGIGARGGNVSQFDIEGFEKLNLIRQR